MTNLEKVKELYEQGLTSKQISEKLAMKNPNVSMYLNKAFGKDRPKYKRIPERNRKYTLNENYFDNLDTEDKFYFLGLLYADGCVSKKSSAVQIALQEQDRYILEKFKEYINSNKPLGFIKSTKINGFNTDKEYFRKNQYILVINSNKIKEKLAKLGLISKKSLIIKFPEFLENKLIHHFIRGYFDGDGGIYGYDKNRWEINIASNSKFSEKLCNFLKNKGINCRFEKHNTNNIFYVRITGRLNCIEFYNYLYKDASIYLTRKYDKFQKCINSTKSIRYGNTWKKEE